LTFRLLILLIAVIFFSCSKEDKTVLQKQTSEQKQKEEIENPQDTNMTAEERFSSSIMIDFLDNSEDEDLASYLQDELYKYSETYRGASVLQVTNNLWFVTLENQNNIKNFLLQKFIDFKNSDYYFKLTETNLKLSDVIAAANLYNSTKPEKGPETPPTQNTEQK
jgi:hypothetical protein